MPDTPDVDRNARDMAERVFAAYAKQANVRIHPGVEQTLLTRLAEALRPLIGRAADRLVDAANRVLDDIELTVPDLRGPRIASLNPVDKAVTTRDGSVPVISGG